ncbi:MAG: DUF402 domain-containing protein [Clostridiales bacterium]|nr:DUF402 domain-containing protein [Clostridiales bacterium]
MRQDIQLYRKRYIPDELIELNQDHILHADSNLIVTSWEVLHPRSDFSHGVSAYLIDKHIKVSKFLKPDHSLLYWYCDIIHTEYEEAQNRYTFIDLLADILVYPDHSYRLVDLDELADAIKKQYLPSEQIPVILETIQQLLNDIYSGKFQEYQNLLDQYQTV